MVDTQLAHFFLEFRAHIISIEGTHVVQQFIGVAGGGFTSSSRSFDQINQSGFIQADDFVLGFIDDLVGLHKSEFRAVTVFTDQGK